MKNQCNKCKKIFINNSDLIRHNERKYPCKTNTENNDEKINTENNNDFLESIVKKMEIMMDKKMEIMMDKKSESNDKTMLNLQETNIKLQQEILNLNNKIKILEENNKLIEKPKASTNIKIVNNNNITINVIEFGKENLDFLEKKTCINKILYTGYKSLENYVTLVHFNKDKPEYHNMYISSKKNKNEIMINNGEKWIVANTNTIIDDLFSKGTTFMKDNLEKFKDELTENKIKGIQRFLNDYDDDNKTIKDVTKDLILVIYNNRDIAIK
jgi:hypothetical protein